MKKHQVTSGKYQVKKHMSNWCVGSHKSKKYIESNNDFFSNLENNISP